MAVVERVYIGGFDADRLSGEEIVSRLQSQLADSITIEGDIYYGSCFCHMNVTAKKEGTSGLECISKMYHNVKWKGFKLRVEKARPHFLERLEVERQQRTSVVRLDHPKANLPLDPPRFLKIKQRYGQECWRVDTRPLVVKDWPRFEKLRRKLTKQQAKSDQQEASRKPKPAIHFTFALDSQPCQQDVVHGQRDVSESEAESDSSSDVDGERGKYKWSDDDEESNDSSELSIEAVETSKTPFKEPSMLSEFEPALDDLSSQISEESDSDNSSSVSHTTDLEGEVERGLNVLSEMFPDIKKVAPALVQQTPSQDDFRRSDVLMERYDPSQASAEKYRVHDVMATESVDEEMEVQEKEEDLPSQPCSDVYEEKKLEAVFRQARESTVSDSAAVAPSADSGSGNFSFAFQLESDEKVELPTSTQTFEFAFSVNDDSLPKASISDKTSDTQFESIDVATSVESNTKRRRTIFTSDELSAYVEDFFLMGDGEKIRDDLERYRGDEAIRQRWLQERKALTLDWKRKRKHAVSRRKNA